MAIDVGWDTKWVSFKDHLLPNENLDHKVNDLNVYVERFRSHSTEFCNLLKNPALYNLVSHSLIYQK